eukprot:124586-Pleurochrysis_carterae.AAC.1
MRQGAGGEERARGGETGGERGGTKKRVGGLKGEGKTRCSLQKRAERRRHHAGCRAEHEPTLKEAHARQPEKATHMPTTRMNLHRLLPPRCGAFAPKLDAPTPPEGGR